MSNAKHRVIWINLKRIFLVPKDFQERLSVDNKNEERRHVNFDISLV